MVMEYRPVLDQLQTKTALFVYQYYGNMGFFKGMRSLMMRLNKLQLQESRRRGKSFRCHWLYVGIGAVTDARPGSW